MEFKELNEMMKSAVLSFVKKHEKEPTKILLGQKEFAVLKEHLGIKDNELSTSKIMYSETVLISELKFSKSCIEVI